MNESLSNLERTTKMSLLPMKVPKTVTRKYWIAIDNGISPIANTWNKISELVRSTLNEDVPVV